MYTGAGFARELETEETLVNIVFTHDKIREKIKNLKSNSATGPDKITVNILQAAREELLEPLLKIYNNTKIRNCSRRLEKSDSNTNFYKGDKRRCRKLQTGLVDKYSV